MSDRRLPAPAPAVAPPPPPPLSPASAPTPTNQNNQLRLLQYRRARRIFSIKVYLIAIIFLVITFVQWTPALFITAFQDLFYESYYIAAVLLAAALLVETAFVVWERLRFKFPFNWILAILIVELITWALVWAVVESALDVFWISFGITAVVVGASIAVGICIPRDLTLHVLVLFVLSTVFFAGSVIILVFSVLAYFQFSVFFYLGFIIAVVIMFIMYHAQTIHGGRFAEMRLVDFLLAALIIYHDFILILFLIMFLFTSLFDEDMDHTKFARITAQANCTLCERNITIITIP